MEKTQKRDRIRALERFQQGESVSTIANSLGYSRRWVYKWIERSRVASPEVPWPEDRSRRPHANPRNCSVEMVEAVKLARFHLYNRGLFSDSLLQSEQRGFGDGTLRTESGVEQGGAANAERHLVELVPSGDSPKCPSGQ